MFDKGYIIAPSQEEEARARAELYIKSYGQMGYDGYCPGDRDVKGFGIAFLAELQKQSKFPFLCANVVDKAGKPVFTAYKVYERRGHRIGVFGLLGSGAEPKEGVEEYRVTDAFEVAREVVKKLVEEEQVQVVVLLGHLDSRDVERMAKEVPEIDIVLGGQGQSKSNFFTQFGKSWFSEAGARGQNINAVILNIPGATRKPFVVRETAVKLKQELDSLDARIQRYVQMIKNPTPTKGTRGSSVDRYQVLVKNLVRQREELAQKARELSAVDVESPFLSLLGVEVPKTLEDEPQVIKWIEEHKSRFPTPAPVAHPNVAPARPGAKSRSDKAIPTPKVRTPRLPRPVKKAQ